MAGELEYNGIALSHHETGSLEDRLLDELLQSDSSRERSGANELR